MELRFKVALQKEWILLYDKIIYDGREIMLSEISSVSLAQRSSLLKNGIIQIKVHNKIIRLAYPDKMNDEGERALLYLQDNCSELIDTNRKKNASEIKKEIAALPYRYEFGTKNEIAELQNILSIDETIKALANGLSSRNTWLIVCTTKRVLMLDNQILSGLKLIDIPLDKINSVSHVKGLIFGSIAITDNNATRVLENIDNESVSFFADAVTRQKELYIQSKDTPVASAVNTISDADEILKFKNLLDIGVLTQEEFEMKKKAILGL